MKNSTINTFNTANSNAMLGDGFLVPMTDFVSELERQVSNYKLFVINNWIFNYAKFLKQRLKLEMFVPCDENGNILEEQRMIERSIGFEEKDVFWDIDEVEMYKKAKAKVLFKEFELISETNETWLFKINGQFPRIVGKKLTIESLRIFKDKIKLSQNALNAIFGKTIA